MSGNGSRKLKGIKCRCKESTNSYCNTVKNNVVRNGGVSLFPGLNEVPLLTKIHYRRCVCQCYPLTQNPASSPVSRQGDPVAWSALRSRGRLTSQASCLFQVRRSASCVGGADRSRRCQPPCRILSPADRVCNNFCGSAQILKSLHSILPEIITLTQTMNFIVLMAVKNRSTFRRFFICFKDAENHKSL